MVHFLQQICWILKSVLRLRREVIDVSKLFNPQSFLTAIKQVCGDAHVGIICHESQPLG